MGLQPHLIGSTGSPGHTGFFLHFFFFNPARFQPRVDLPGWAWFQNTNPIHWFLTKDNSSNLTSIQNKIITKGVVQLVRSYVCFLEVISSSLTNLKVTEDLHSRVCEISRGTRKLTRAPMLIIKKKLEIIITRVTQF